MTIGGLSPFNDAFDGDFTSRYRRLGHRSCRKEGGSHRHSDGRWHNCDTGVISGYTLPDYGFVGTDTRCEDNGMVTISSFNDCHAAAQSLGYLARDRDGAVGASTYWDRSYGCSWHRFGNVEFWSKGKRDVGCTFRGYAGCMCRIP